MFNSSQSINLHDLNASKVSVYIPAIVYISILMVTGSVGNFFVIVVFGFRIKKRSLYTLCVLVMAIYDMAACCLAMPGLLVDMLNPFMFYSSVGCKILRYGYHVIGFGTSMTTMLLGIDRYRRICKPFAKQITLVTARLVLFIQFCIAIVNSIPSVFLNESSAVETGSDNLFGRHCSVSDAYSGTIYPVFYESYLLILVVANIVTLVIFYTHIGCELYRRTLFRNSLKARVSLKAEPDQNEDNLKKNSIRQPVFENKIKPDTSVIEAGLQPMGSYVMNTTSSGDHGSLSKRITSVTFTIILVYIVSYLPWWIVQFLTISTTDFVKLMTFSGEAAYNIFIYSFALYNVVNPIVYLAIDTEFRSHSKAIVCAIRDKLRQTLFCRFLRQTNTKVIKL